MKVISLAVFAALAVYFVFADKCPKEIKRLQGTMVAQFCNVSDSKLEEYYHCTNADGFDLETSFLACSRADPKFEDIVDMKSFYKFICTDQLKPEAVALVCCDLSVEVKATGKTIEQKAESVRKCSFALYPKDNNSTTGA